MTISGEHSLYGRLGGYEVIAQVIGGMYDRMLNDPRIGIYWMGHSNYRKNLERQLFIDFVAQFTGGPVVYQGVGIEISHEGLGITEVDWAAFVALAAETMSESDLASTESAELFALVTSFKASITDNSRNVSEPASISENPNGLTRREMEVLRFVGLGKNNSEIAEELFISLNTVTRHLSHIFFKTGASNRVEAAVFAVRHSIL